MNQFPLFSDVQDTNGNAQLILSEQRKQQTLLLLQQQEIDKTLSEMAAPPASLFDNQLLLGSNPIHVECRNIIALQEELKRQETRRRAEEILQAKIQEQALLMELQKQADLQQNAAEQIMSHFVELDQIAARQEIFRQLGQIGVGSDNFMMNAQNDLINSIRAQSSAAPSIQDFIPLTGQRHLNSSHSDPAALFSGLSQASPLGMNRVLATMESLQPNLPSNTQSSLPSTLPINFQHSLENLSSDFIQKINGAGQAHSRNNLLTIPLNADLQYSSQTAKPTSRQEIRFFNNGKEVNKQGKVIKSESSCKKRKTLCDDVITIDCARQPLKQRQKKSVKLPTTSHLHTETERSTPPKKSPLKLRKYLSSKEEKKEEPKKPVGSHSGQVRSVFPKKKKIFRIQPLSKDKEEEKLDAANALVGLMKNA